MANVIKKYWDIFGGVATGVTLTLLAKFELSKIQLYYSIIILILVSIGVWKIIKQTLDKKKENKRLPNALDSAVDSQRGMKAVRLAQNPTRDGEEIGKLLIRLWGGIKKIMEKLKTLWSKYKGYLLTFALAVLTAVENCGGFINALCGGVFTINGVEVLPVVTLAATTIVGLISNGYSAEQNSKIKALFSKKDKNAVVNAEIKKALKTDEAKLKEYNKELTTLNNTLNSCKIIHEAKKQMYEMTPRLATEEDVQNAANEVVNTEAKIVEKKAEIEKLNKNIGAYKSQLK